MAFRCPSNDYQQIWIDSNKIIRQVDPHLPFPTGLQGIDAFDEDWSYVTVTNNVVITSACWGIAFSSVHSGVIANNTVVNDGLVAILGGCVPTVSVGDKTHEGSKSNSVSVRNNIVNALTIDNLDPGVTADHNVALAPGGAEFYWYVSGVLTRYGPAGTYGTNLIATGGPASEFVDFDSSTLTYDVMLKKGAPAIGAGTSASAPAVDILGVTRTAPYDAGAYSYRE